MAILSIATPLVHSNALRRSGMIAEVRGTQGRKASRMACRQASVSAAHRVDASDTADRQAIVTVRQSLSSPLLNLSTVDLIAAFLEEETHEEAQHADVAQALHKLESVPEVPQAVRRRSERVIFTEEKAKILRKQNRASLAFHDKWYHSAIATKLASPE